MKIALIQLNPTIAALEQNAEKVVREAHAAAEQGAELAVFSELTLCGYPPRDWLDRPAFLRAQRQELEALAQQLPQELPCIVGVVDETRIGNRPALRNAAALLRGGRIEALVHKRLLPNYDIFDDARYFGAGDEQTIVSIGGRKVGITICEDLWNEVPSPIAPAGRHHARPATELLAQGAELIVNIAASPFTLEKHAARAEMFGAIARHLGVPVVYVNQVGGNDDLIFDGGSALFGADGRTLARLSLFAEDRAVVDLNEGGCMRDWPGSRAAVALDALTLGLRDFVRKCGLRGAIVGLSGGIDSALTCALAVRALGAEHVVGVGLPTRYSSDHSIEDARELAEALGIRFELTPIEPIYQAYVEHLTPHLDALGAQPANETTFENIQARIRCGALMAMSNRLGLMLLNTGNKSEVAVGYCTLYGDMAGGLAVLGDVYKTFVYELAEEINRQADRALIPQRTIDKPPSAELRPDQRDSDSLPEYDALDPILERAIEGAEGFDAIVAAGYDPPTVRRVLGMLRGAEHKRRQLPPPLIITSKAFGMGWRYPLATAHRME